VTYQAIHLAEELARPLEKYSVTFKIRDYSG
jgi:hypothetical protein